jgi:DNA-binding MarR family transcriptional regulator
MAPSRRREETTLKRPRKTSEDTPNLRLFYALRRVSQGVEVDSRRLAKELNVTGPQLVCLRGVVTYEPTTATDISHLVYLSPSTVVGIFDRLESKGLAKRRRDRKDRRVVFVTATDAGRDLVVRAPHPLFEALGKLLKTLSKTEQQALVRAIDELARLIEGLPVPA